MSAITATLAAENQRHHGKAQGCAGEAVEHASNTGEALLKAKAEAGHGKFLKWFAAAGLTFSDRTASGYMRFAAEIPKLSEANRQRVANKSLRHALEYLAAPRQTKLQKAEAFLLESRAVERVKAVQELAA